MTARLAFKFTLTTLFTYLALLVGASGAVETYALHFGGPVVSAVVGDVLQGGALVLFVYQHVRFTQQGLSLTNIATVCAVLVGASGAIQTYVIHVGGAPAGAIAGGVLQALALLVTLYQQVRTPAAAQTVRALGRVEQIRREVEARSATPPA